MIKKLRFLCPLLLEDLSWRSWRPFGIAQDMLGASDFPLCARAAQSPNLFTQKPEDP
jgi:hypothetical protein